MINFRLIREDTIPVINSISSYEFVGGEKIRIALQMLNKYDDNAFMIPAGSTAHVLLNQTGGAQLDVLATIHPNNSSVIYIDLTSSQTLGIISGPITVKIIGTDPADIKYAVRNNVFSKVKV